MMTEGWGRERVGEERGGEGRGRGRRGVVKGEAEGGERR